MDESYRKFYWISNILLKILFHSATINKCMLGMETFKNTFLLSVISVHMGKKKIKYYFNSSFPQSELQINPHETYWHKGMSSLMMQVPPFLQYSSGQTTKIKVKISMEFPISPEHHPHYYIYHSLLYLSVIYHFISWKKKKNPFYLHSVYSNW